MKIFSKTSGNGFKVALLAPALLALALPIGCGGKKPVNDNAPHPRIISHSPAITQILFDLGLGDHLVGVTNWCDLPADGPHKNISRIADAQGIRTEMALVARPDIIFTQTDTERGMFKNVSKNLPAVNIVQVRIESLEDILFAVDAIGQITGREEQAAKLLKKMRQQLDAIKPLAPPAKKLRVLFSSSHESPMVAGPGTYIGDLFELAGAENAGQDIPGKMLWRKSKVEHIIAARPDVLIIFSIQGREEQVKKFWLSRKDIPAAQTGRVFVVTDSRWLRPNSKFVELASDVRKMLDTKARQ